MCTQQAHARFTFYFLLSAQVHVRESHIDEVLEEEQKRETAERKAREAEEARIAAEAKARGQLKEEPSAEEGGKPIFTLSFRMPDGARLTRKFDGQDTLQVCALILAAASAAAAATLVLFY